MNTGVLKVDAEKILIKGVSMTGVSLAACLELVAQDKPLPPVDALRLMAVRERQQRAREKAWTALRAGK